MITNAIHRAISKKRERNYPLTYWAIDLHATIIKPTYSKPQHNEKYEFYENAIDVLQWLTELPNQILILWTSTKNDDIQLILKELSKHCINFDYVNRNPECTSSSVCCFDKKFYFDILLDDKAGFDPKQDWTSVKNCLIKFKEFKRIRRFYTTNEVIEKLETKFQELKFNSRSHGLSISVTIPKPKYVNHIEVSMNGNFYTELENFLRDELNITARISYNNDKTIFSAWYDVNTSAFGNY